ncbi:MAG TPA: DUF2785 domain-containing protein [Dictyobacter sp.]|nr:DUF2785 domain-containing protein [Dictyobacter sp.]
MELTFWHSIVAHDYAIPSGYTVQTMTPELLAYLASPDPELREEVACTLLSTWIGRGHYSSAELYVIAQRMIDNLQVGLGEQESETVHLRTFSLLILNEVISYDHRYPFLEESLVRTWLQIVLEYFAAERDLRGYVEGFGWAHAVAHAADSLMLFARHRYMVGADLERILHAIADKLLTPDEYVYMHVEDERLAYAVVTALRRNLLDQNFLSPWLERLVYRENRTRWIAQHFTSAVGPAIYANVRNFLRSLYFQLVMVDSPPMITPILRMMLLNALKVMDHGFYALS